MSLKVKLISFISLFMLMIGVLIIGVFAATQQQITMQGSVSFNVPDKSLYVKNVRYQETGGEAVDIESFIPGYINGEFNMDLSSLNTMGISHGTFALYFDIINTIDIEWTITDVDISAELENAGVTVGYSGVISTNDLTDTDDDGFKNFNESTLIDGTLTLTITSPNLSVVNLADIVVTLDEYRIVELEDFEFDNGVQAFMFCGLSTFTIPISVTFMGFYPFSECSNLSNIIFEDTASSWLLTDPAGYYDQITFTASEALANALEYLTDQYFIWEKVS